MISQRYYQHYLGILNNPEDQPQTEAPPATAEAAEPAADEAIISSGEPLPPDEDLASIPEITPIKLTLPDSAKPEEKKGAEKKGLKKLCFIATAAYGSPLAQEVVLLQDFRDRYLAPHALGERFIQAYYRLSPPLASQISNNKPLRRLTRALLTPVIFLIKKGTGK